MVEHPDDRALLERALLAPLNAEGNNLRQLLEQVSGHWGYEGPVYRFYHQSLKVFALESTTTAIVSRPAALLPERSLNPVDHRSGYHRSRDLFAEFLGLLHTVRCPPYVRDELPRLAS